jgi:hypothetical protein
MHFLMNKALKQKKEVGMKKLVIVALAVFLALPVLSHAGSATSKWDLTIGGFVGTYVQWSDQNDSEWGAGSFASRRTGTRENVTDEISNFGMNIDPRLGFLVKGPDTWGAKTSSYIEFDFAGIVAGTNGGARIRQSFMKFEWAKDSILIGNATTPYRTYGLSPTTASNGGTIHALPGAFGGPRSAQLTWEHMWTKELATKFALVYPNQDGWRGAGAADSYTQSLLPNIEGGVKWTSASCGVIGNKTLAFSMNGIYGRKKILRGPDATARAAYSQKQEDGWYGQAAFAIPIIPERNQNKAGALLFFTEVSAGQGLVPVNGGMMAETYLRPGGDYATPRSVAYQAGFNVWFSNTVWMSALYNSVDRQFSNYYNRTYAAAATIKRNQLYNVALFYMPNPAVELCAEYSRLHTNYAINAAGLKKFGTSNAVRLGAYYFF